MRVITEEQRARHRETSRAWKQANKDKNRQYQQNYKRDRTDYLAAYARKNRAKRRAQELDRIHRRQLAEAGRIKPDRCEVCGRNGPVTFDHCHQRDVFRGWLCHGCNLVLGHVKDDPDHLRKLIVYLERTKNAVSPQLEMPV